MEMLSIRKEDNNTVCGNKNVVTLTRSDIYRGHLLLVNRNHALRQMEGSLELHAIDNLPVFDTKRESMRLEKTCLKQLTALLEACNGTQDILVVSGYRSQDEQTELYEASLRENGAAFTSSYVARPGESEHQTGLAVDVGQRTEEVDYICPSFPDTGACQDFKQLAALYGFIQRYKESKEAITNIAAEPWHFRYVGYPHSAIMEEREWCLEEYIEHVKQYQVHQEHAYVEDKDGRAKVEIYYVPIFQDIACIEVPNGTPYTVSGDNQDGCIITIYHDKGTLEKRKHVSSENEHMDLHYAPLSDYYRSKNSQIQWAESYDGR
ncbi:M15 family metallopeptidase [Paenibacillus sp. UMB4589-SE434]|uniref:M15 family metallopeptidase n=1 Tax=Paenibacillus sp. UMB4589-SE434 TaxID=3046314 RepID=UPI00254E3D5C|nr:M15 family metallopeptidase [Paenibacillus sp. UMB4589-SE434]MDK8179593.1 M15 family metallopeptidase [Paenibacillus sp. UMB4589-SE434]